MSLRRLRRRRKGIAQALRELAFHLLRLGAQHRLAEAAELACQRSIDLVADLGCLALLHQLRGSRAEVSPGGTRAANFDYWIAYVEAELSRVTSSDAGLWQRALAGMRRRGHAEHEMYTQFRLAEALAQAGDVDRATAELGEAHERAVRLGAGLVEQIEDLARRHRLKLPGLTEPAGSATLTARELEVLALVVKRLTNGLAGLAKQRKVEVVRGTGVFTSMNQVEVTTDDGSVKTVSFEQAIIAAGSEPMTLPFIPTDDPRVIDSTGALELDDVPQRLLVLRLKSLNQ